jgi:methylated-DNA-protein-cysteine methyltransferase-like protein
MPVIMKKNNLYHTIYALVDAIPPGKVATYGQVARFAGIPRDARRVAYALHALPEQTKIPWHRVINSRGCISYALSRNGSDDLQKVLLQHEGVLFNQDGIIPLEQFQYRFE